MIKKSSPRARVYDQMRALFGSDSVMLIGIDDPSLDTPQGLARIRNLKGILEAQPLVTQVTSLVDLQRIDPKAGSLDVAHYLPGGDLDQATVDKAFKALRDDEFECLIMYCFFLAFISSSHFVTNINERSFIYNVLFVKKYLNSFNIK